MNNDVKVKQQVIDKIKNSSNILVTVSNSPSVDGLSAALGLTLLLDKLDKHATAVFSGTIPPAITFLNPDKTFENSVDSLRDFIIALNKEKADHLRYKIDGDVVKIFITPYRTTLSSEDLEFSQGDYNVELVLALGVESQDNLDAALAAHGRILHDATVITVSAAEQTSKLGSLDWRDEQASSLSEMLVSLSESLKKDDKSILDEQIATAFLTGIVAATDRFSNTRTSSRVMTLAAQLMAAGADQQLIASKLQESHEIQPDRAETDDNSDKKALVEGESAKLNVAKDEAEPPKEDKNDGELAIDHDKDNAIEQAAAESVSEKQKDAAVVAEQALSDIKASQPEPVAPPEPKQLRGAVPWTPPASPDEPAFGGTLNATTEQAELDKQREEADKQNKIILNHAYIGENPALAETPAAIDTSNAERNVNAFDNTAPFNASSSPVVAEPPADDSTGNSSGVQPNSINPSAPTLAEIEAQNRMSPIALPEPPPLPDFSVLPPVSTEPPQSVANNAAVEPSIASSAPPAPQPDDPSQFHIPGQQQ